MTGIGRAALTGPLPRPGQGAARPRYVCRAAPAPRLTLTASVSLPVSRTRLQRPLADGPAVTASLIAGSPFWGAGSPFWGTARCTCKFRPISHRQPRRGARGEGPAVDRGHAANGPCQRQEAGGLTPSHEAGCCPYAHGTIGSPAPGRPTRPSLADSAALVSHLYDCQGLSTYEIATAVGISRQRVGRLLHKAGVPVKPRGAGRPRPPDAEQDALTDLAVRLYLQSNLPSGQISALIGVPERAIRSRLRARGVQMRPRGRSSRQDRAAAPTEALAHLYVHAGLTAAETGRRLGVPGRVVLRTAHDQGLAVRVGGPVPRQGPSDIELIDALYADPLVRQALFRHGIAPRPSRGPIWQRFPVPVDVSPDLAKELYVSCGLGLRHIELISGQPAETIRSRLRGQNIKLRPPGGRSPFMRRWRGTSEG